MRKLILASFLFACVLAVGVNGFAASNTLDEDTPVPKIATDAHGDPVLKAMLAELKRSQEKLQLGQLDPG